jgi:hypothetical protein
MTTQESSAAPGVQSQSLTEAMLRDLEKCVRVYERTVDTVDYRGGEAIRLRTGAALLRRGLVQVGNRGSANRCIRWLPTAEGIACIKSTEEHT